MADVIVFDFVERKVVIETPDGNSRPAPAHLQVEGVPTPAPTRAT